MKPAISKEAALKALLLLVLAANVSYNPFKVLNAVNLAEESVPARSAAAPIQPRFAAGRPAVAPAPGAQPAPRAAVAPAAAPRFTTDQSSATYHEELRNWCGVSFLIKWEAISGQNAVRTTVVRRFPQESTLFTRTQSGSFDSRVNNTPARDDEEKYLQAETKSRLGSECADAAPAAVAGGSNTSAGSNTNAQAQADADAAAARARLQADIKNCKRGSDGKSLDAQTRLDCNIDRLGSIDAADDDDHKGQRDAQHQFNSIVDQIQKDLRREVKESLVGDDQAGARELVENAVKSIQDAGKDIGISATVVQKAIVAIRNMYGAEFAGKQLKDKADQDQIALGQIKDNYDMALASGNQWAVQSSLLQGQYYANTMNQDLTAGMNQLRSYERMNWIDASDFTDFTASIQAMNPQLNFFRNGGRMTSAPGALPTADQITVGSDIANVRSGLAQQYRSIYGGIPVRPQININMTPSSASPMTRTSTMSMPTPVFTSGIPNSRI